MIIAHLRAGPHPTADLLAIGFVVARLVYVGLYVANQATLRSLAWFVAFFCALALFFVG